MQAKYVVQDYGSHGWVDWKEFDVAIDAREFMVKCLADYDNGRFRMVERTQRIIMEGRTNDVTE